MSTNYPQQNSTHKNLILSLVLLGVVMSGGYFVLHNTATKNNTLTASTLTSLNGTPLSLPTSTPVTNIQDTPKNPENVARVPLATSPTQAETHRPVGGDPLVKGGFKVLGGSSGGGGGTISFDAVSGDTVVTGSSLTWQHTVAAGGVLFVSCSSFGDSPTVTGVTYNGVAMTQLWNTDLSGGVVAQSSGWLMVNPATGAAHDIVCTLSGSTGGYIAGAATSWTGVETSSVAAAHRTIFTGGDAGGGNPSLTITDSQNGDVIVAGLGNYNANPVPADTPRVTQNQIGGSDYDHNHESLAATGANEVINYTGGEYFTMGATALVPAAGGGTGGSVKFR